MKYIAAVMIVLLVGCQSKAEEKEINDIQEYRGFVRHQFFTECLQLTANIKRQADDDVSDIVKECATQAYYMTLYIKTVPQVPK